MDAQNHLQGLQDRSRTSRSTSGTSRSTSRTTFEVILGGFKDQNGRKTEEQITYASENPTVQKVTSGKKNGKEERIGTEKSEDQRRGTQEERKSLKNGRQECNRRTEKSPPQAKKKLN